MDATWHYIPKVLREGEFREACEQAVGISATDDSECEIVVRYPRRDGRPGVNEDDIHLNADSLRAIVDLGKIDLRLTSDRGCAKDIWIAFRGVANGSVVEATAIGGESISCLERIAAVLALERTERPKDHSKDDLEGRVATLEASVAKISHRNLRCFISFKFDDPGTVDQVNILKRMLEALNIEWITGEQYEPRRIEDKVRARLRADADFLIAVITKAGQSNWIRDELGDANTRELRIVLLKEQGVTFDAGIFGSLEYIPYHLAIEQTFPSLVEGINFIKAETSAKT